MSADRGYTSATVEINLTHQLLADNVQIIVAPSSGTNCSFKSIYHTCFKSVSPIVVYALTDCNSLNSNEVEDLKELQRQAPKIPIFFVRSQRTSDGPSNPSANCSNPQFTNSLTLFQQCSLGFLSPSKSASNGQELVSPYFATRTRTSRKRSKDGVINSELVESFQNIPSFVKNVLHSHLVLATNTLHAPHKRSLRSFHSWMLAASMRHRTR